MKDYKTIVNDRYDQQQYDSKAVLNNIYSPINPVGFYGEFKAAQILSDFIKMLDFDIEGGGTLFAGLRLRRWLQNADHVGAARKSSLRIRYGIFRKSFVALQNDESGYSL